MRQGGLLDNTVSFYGLKETDQIFLLGGCMRVILKTFLKLCGKMTYHNKFMELWMLIAGEPDQSLADFSNLKQLRLQMLSTK